MLHIPVLLSETIDAIFTNPDGVYVDCTLGGGGHTQALMQRLSPSGRIIALDRDNKVLQATVEKLSSPQIYACQSDFSALDSVLRSLDITAVDGVMMDLGVSSFQLDDGDRGFSFHQEAPLDMRMSQEDPVTAADLLRTASEKELGDWLFIYGEERYARLIARSIVEERSRRSIDTTTKLAELIQDAVPAAYRRKKHPARKTFQALRIVVNQELEALKQVLPQALQHLKPGGRLCVITFHSLEDRITKQFMRDKAQNCTCPPELPVCVCNHRAELKLINRRGWIPSAAEIANNSRARSARLRVAEKI